MKTKATKTFVARVEGKDPFRRIEPTGLYCCNYAFRVKIAVEEATSMGQTRPAIWYLSPQGEPAYSCGGCTVRVFSHRSEINGPIYSFAGLIGPDVVLGELADYEHGARAMRRVAEEIREIEAQRGPHRDAAEQMGRLLEACGIERVYVEQDPDANGNPWRILTVGALVESVRRLVLAETVPADDVAEPAGELVEA